MGVDLKGVCGAAATCTGTCGPAHDCIGSGAGAQCAKSRCTSSSGGVGPAVCSAEGAACPTEGAIAFDCGAYACEPAFGACLSSCRSSTDCAGGYLCDTGSKTCVEPASESASSGCSSQRPQREGGAPWTALALGALVTMTTLRRRR